jgi:hypothetical protein
MLETDCQRQDHKNNVHIKDYKEEASEEVEDFGKEIPALIPKQMRLVKLYLSHNYPCFNRTYHSTPIFGDKSFTVRIKPYVLQKHGRSQY